MSNSKMSSATMTGVVVIEADVDVCRGKHLMDPSTLPKGALDQMPPAELATLGSLSTMSSKDVQPLLNTRQEALRVLSASGTRFMGGWAVAESAVKPVLARLKTLGHDFAGHRQHLLDNYEVKTKAWASLHPEWEAVTLAAVRPVEEVAAKTHFRVRAFKVSAMEIEGENYLHEEMANLPTSLLSEVGKEAKAFLDKSLSGKEQVTQRVRKTLLKMHSKLDSMGFLDQDVAEVATRLGDIIAALPVTGPISGTDLSLVRTAMRALEKGQPLPDVTQTATLLPEVAPVAQAPVATLDITHTVATTAPLNWVMQNKVASVLPNFIPQVPVVEDNSFTI